MSQDTKDKEVKEATANETTKKPEATKEAPKEGGGSCCGGCT